MKREDARKDIIRHCDAYGRYGAIASRFWLDFRDECKIAFTECLALGLVEGREMSERGDHVVRYFSTPAGRALLEGECKREIPETEEEADEWAFHKRLP